MPFNSQTHQSNGAPASTMPMTRLEGLHINEALPGTRPLPREKGLYRLWKGTHEGRPCYIINIITQNKGILELRHLDLGDEGDVFYFCGKLQPNTQMVLPTDRVCYIDQPTDRQYTFFGGKPIPILVDFDTPVVVEARKRAAEDRSASDAAESSSSSSGAPQPALKRARPEMPADRMKDALAGYYDRSTWPSEIEPRDYQVDILKEYQQALEEGHTKCVFPISTGAGKTYLFNMITLMTGRRTLILVPRDNLLAQTKESFKKFCPGLQVGLLKDAAADSFTQLAGDKIANRCDVVLGTYQWLKHKDNIDKINFEEYETLILDEAHHCLSKKSQEIVRRAEAAGQHILAFSATPWVGEKPEGEGISTVYELLGFQAQGEDNPISGVSLMQAIEKGANCPVSVTIVKPQVDAMRFNGGATDISVTDAAKKINRDDLNKMIVHTYLNVADGGERLLGKKAIIFCCDIKHADAVVEAFNAIPLDTIDPNGFLRDAYVARKEAEARRNHDEDNRQKCIAYPKPFPGSSDFQKQKWRNEFKLADSVHSNKNKADNDAIMAQHKVGGSLILIGADKIMEGYDDPEVECVMIARPTKSDRVMLQVIGRGTRVNIAKLNKVCSVVGFYYPSRQQSTMKQPYEYISEEAPRFSYGDVEGMRQQAQSKEAVGYEPPEGPFSVEGASRYEVIDSPQHSEIVIAAKSKKTSLGERMNRIKQRRVTRKEIAIAEGLQQLATGVNKLGNVFDTIEQSIVRKPAVIVNDDVTMEDVSIPASSSSDESSEESTESEAQPTAVNTDSIIMTRQMLRTLNQVKARLSLMKKFLSPVRVKSNRSHTSGASESETTHAIHSTQEDILRLVTMCNGLYSKVHQYLQASTLGVVEDVSAVASDPEIDIELHMQEMSQSMAELSHQLEANQASFVQAYQAEKLARESEAAAEKAKSAQPPKQTRLRKAVSQWYVEHPDATIKTWCEEGRIVPWIDDDNYRSRISAGSFSQSILSDMLAKLKPENAAEYHDIIKQKFLDKDFCSEELQVLAKNYLNIIDHKVLGDSSLAHHVIEDQYRLNPSMVKALLQHVGVDAFEVKDADGHTMLDCLERNLSSFDKESSVESITLTNAKWCNTTLLMLLDSLGLNVEQKRYPKIFEMHNLKRTQFSEAGRAWLGNDASETLIDRCEPAIGLRRSGQPESNYCVAQVFDQPVYQDRILPDLVRDRFDVFLKGNRISIENRFLQIFALRPLLQYATLEQLLAKNEEGHNAFNVMLMNIANHGIKTGKSRNLEVGVRPLLRQLLTRMWPYFHEPIDNTGQTAADTLVACLAQRESTNDSSIELRVNLYRLLQEMEPGLLAGQDPTGKTYIEKLHERIRQYIHGCNEWEANIEHFVIGYKSEDALWSHVIPETQAIVVEHILSLIQDRYAFFNRVMPTPLSDLDTEKLYAYMWTTYIGRSLLDELEGLCHNDRSKHLLALVKNEEARLKPSYFPWHQSLVKEFHRREKQRKKDEQNKLSSASQSHMTDVVERRTNVSGVGIGGPSVINGSEAMIGEGVGDVPVIQSMELASGADQTQTLGQYFAADAQGHSEAMSTGGYSAMENDMDFIALLDNLKWEDMLAETGGDAPSSGSASSVAGNPQGFFSNGLAQSGSWGLNQAAQPGVADSAQASELGQLQSSNGLSTPLNHGLDGAGFGQQGLRDEAQGEATEAMWEQVLFRNT